LATGREAEGAWLWGCALLAATPEAALQVVATGTDSSPVLLDALVVGHLLAFGLVETWWLRRRGFFAMHGMRLAYYGIWLFAWGYLRLA
jgi:hypothetical protein